MEENFPNERIKVLNEVLSPNKKYLINHTRNLPIARLFHGTTSKTARNICATGFASLALIDQGWFGNGIYLTDNPVYCLEYCKPKQEPCLVVTDVLLFNSFPIISEDAPPNIPSNEFRFYGKPHYKNFMTNVVPVIPWGPLDYRPPISCTPTDATEFVIFNENHLLPRVLLHLTKIPSPASSLTPKSKPTTDWNEEMVIEWIKHLS